MPSVCEHGSWSGTGVDVQGNRSKKVRAAPEHASQPSRAVDAMPWIEEYVTVAGRHAQKQQPPRRKREPNLAHGRKIAVGVHLRRREQAREGLRPRRSETV